MLLFPYAVDNPMSRLPLVNWAIILINVVVFWLQPSVAGPFSDGMEFYQTYGLVPADLHVHQFLTSMFMHGDILHLFFNMWFLWTFGNNVNDRLGHVKYAVAYLAVGLVASLGHVIAEYGSDIPCIGASGAVFGVIGLYLVLSPLNDVRVAYLFFFRPGTFSCSGFWIIGFYVAGNLFDAVMDTAGNVAVIAHLAGFGAGFGVGLLLLTKGVVERDDYDFLSWVSGRKKKQLMARFGRGASNAAPLPPPPGLGMAHGAGRVPSARELQAELRGHLASGDVRDALDAYQRFHQAYPRLALGEELQIDVANALFRAGQQVQAAEAFERFARYYPAHPQASDALYSAGMLHARRTGKLDHGRRLLEEAAAVLTDREKVKRAREMLGRLGSAAAARRVRLDGK